MNVDFVQAVKLFFANYVNFKGRSTRAEFWWAILFCFLVSLVCNFLGLSWLSSIASLVLLLPQLAVTVRRLHDTNHSGWWLLLFYVLLFGSLIMMFAGLGIFSASTMALSETEMAEYLTHAMETGQVSFGTVFGGFALMTVITIVYLIWMCKPSGSDNKYGPDPYGGTFYK